MKYSLLLLSIFSISCSGIQSSKIDNQYHEVIALILDDYFKEDPNFTDSSTISINLNQYDIDADLKIDSLEFLDFEPDIQKLSKLSNIKITNDKNASKLKNWLGFINISRFALKDERIYIQINHYNKGECCGGTLYTLERSENKWNVAKSELLWVP